LFLGRIHQKKGLLQLLYGLSILRQSAPREFERWSLVVAGWDDGGHQQEVESLANSLGLAARAHFVGPLVGPAKDAALTCSAAFVLPSFSEGLPMAVLEAFAYHVPVVMTPECNIPEGFTADAAISVSTDPTDLARGLGEMFRMSDSERRRMGDRGRVLVEEKFQWSEVAGKLRSVYSWLLGNGTCPNCVRMD
jgi:poly(glycerol-phosphate) alpha-glucosyltransferase